MDYLPVNTILTFSASMRTVSFNVTLIDDDFVEGDETLRMRLEILTIGNIEVSPSATAPVTIQDDDSESRERTLPEDTTIHIQTKPTWSSYCT